MKRFLRSRQVRFLITAVLVASMAIATVPAIANANLSWILTKGPMTTAHGYYGAAKLQDGRVLAISGDSNGGLTPVTDVYNPASGTWSQTGAVNQPRYGFYDAVTLNSGKVLIAGGTDATASTDYASAELYDPSTGKWGYTGSLNTARRNPVVVKLQDGRVLVASGANGPPDGNRFLFTSEIYDPATGQFTYTTGNLPLAREGGDSGVLLHDGRVMMLGGEGPWFTFSPEVELYNPASDTWSETGSLPHGISGGSLVVLQDGRVMLIGGDYNGSALAEVELYDPATGTWSAAAPLHHARDAADSILLPNGKVLVAGGSDGSGHAVLASEIYDPSANSWTDDALLQHMHVRARMIQLDSGELLMAGGYDSNGPTTASELYTSTPLGGTWISPGNNFTITGNTLHFAAHAFGGAGVDHVNFTAWWQGVNPKVWAIACTVTSPTPGTTDVYECDWTSSATLPNGSLHMNLAGVPRGPLMVSFDVYDKARNSILAPNGTRQGTMQTGWGQAFSYPIGVPDKSGLRQSTGWGIEQGFNVPNGTFRVCATLRQPDGNPDCYHSGEDWQKEVNGVRRGDVTAGQNVYPIAPGRLTWIHTTGTYPGDVIMLEHQTPRGLVYSMYAHVQPSANLLTAFNQGQHPYISNIKTPIATIIAWPGDITNSHLHFEIRGFFIDNEVIHNGVFDQNGGCGCEVGPGYWLESLGGPEAKGWLPPSLVIQDSRQ